ncbi:MAG TPA: hypothetical protein VGH71_04390 [Gammaproteobacteria bacterium]
MRSRFSDGVVIVLLGLALLTAAVHALPALDLQASIMGHPPARAHLGGPGHVTPHQASAS